MMMKSMRRGIVGAFFFIGFVMAWGGIFSRFAVAESEGEDPRRPGYFSATPESSETQAGFFDSRESYFPQPPSVAPRHLPGHLEKALFAAAAALRAGTPDPATADILQSYAEAGEIFSQSAPGIPRQTKS